MRERGHPRTPVAGVLHLTLLSSTNNTWKHFHTSDSRVRLSLCLVTTMTDSEGSLDSLSLGSAKKDGIKDSAT